MADYLNPLNKKVDANQVLIRSYDEEKNMIRVDAEVTATIGTVSVVIDAASGDNIKISDGVDTLAVNPDGSINVDVQNITLSKDNDSIEVFQATHDNLNANANVQQNNTDVSALNPLFTQTTNGALETTQQQVLSELQTIDNSLDAIEVNADLIKIATQSIDSNVDVTLSTRASELTQLELLNSQAIDKAYTRLEVATKNDDGNPTSILVKNGLTTVRTLTLTYDADGDFLSLEKS